MEAERGACATPQAAEAGSRGWDADPGVWRALGQKGAAWGHAADARAIRTEGRARGRARRSARAAARWVPARCHGHVHAECRKEVH